MVQWACHALYSVQVLESAHIHSDTYCLNQGGFEPTLQGMNICAWPSVLWQAIAEAEQNWQFL